MTPHPVPSLPRSSPPVSNRCRLPQRPATPSQPAGNRRVTLRAADGVAITAICYDPPGPVRAHLIVAGAIGVPQSFYRKFATFAAGRGLATMTLDYRGIGLSRPASLRGFHAGYLDWGRLDLAAAVTAMDAEDVPLYMVGHSYAGHAFGMLPNHERVKRFMTFGTGSGWHGWMSGRERARVLLLWHLVGPLLTLGSGYLPWSRLGMGEDLPLQFYREWKRWCRFPNHFFGDPNMHELQLAFARVRTPILAANAKDDRWSPPVSRDAFMAGYATAPVATWDIDVAAGDTAGIGHMGFFRATALPLWEAALDWLTQDQPGDLP